MNIERARSRAWAEIDEDALLHNYALARALCRKETTFICVVKANAYGLGLFHTVQTLSAAGADWFAVATPEEALLARKAAPGAQILLLGPAGGEYLPLLIARNILLTVGREEEGRAAAAAARALGATARAHVKFDTGLHRLGFSRAEDALPLAGLPGLSLEGAYTHLALRSREQSQAQHALFLQMTDTLACRGLRFPMRHMLDSIGLTRFPEWQMDAVRVGAFLYGNVPPAWPRFGEGKSVISFKARVTRVDWTAAGEGVGYDDAPLPRDTRVATLSVGYVDGYPRAFSGRGAVALHGRRAPVLGLICMDQMMVDVTDIPAVAPGDTAVLLGEEISLQEYAETGRLNRNEALALLGRRVPRVYLRDGQVSAVAAEMDAE